MTCVSVTKRDAALPGGRPGEFDVGMVPFGNPDDIFDSLKTCVSITKRIRDRLAELVSRMALWESVGVIRKK